MHFPLPAEIWKPAFTSFINPDSFCQTFRLAVDQYTGTLCGSIFHDKGKDSSCPPALDWGVTWLDYPIPCYPQGALFKKLQRCSFPAFTGYWMSTTKPISAATGFQEQICPAVEPVRQHQLTMDWRVWSGCFHLWHMQTPPGATEGSIKISTKTRSCFLQLIWADQWYQDPMRMNWIKILIFQDYREKLSSSFQKWASIILRSKFSIPSWTLLLQLGFVLNIILQLVSIFYPNLPESLLLPALFNLFFNSIWTVTMPSHRTNMRSQWTPWELSVEGLSLAPYQNLLALLQASIR